MAMVYGSAEAEIYRAAYLRFTDELRGLVIFEHMKPYIMQCQKNFLRLMDILHGCYEDLVFPYCIRDRAAELVELMRESMLNDLWEAYGQREQE